MKESLNLIRRDLGTANQKLQAQPQVKCPEVAGGGPTGCVSTAIFVTVAFVQLILLISYMWYR
jgi:hypothetical protein